MNNIMGRGSLPLTGARVLDLSDEPLVQAGRFLAELGAAVLRVESSTGDHIRTTGPFLGEGAHVERSLRHIQYNAGKRSIAMDLALERTWEVVDRLADQSDVVLAPLEKTRLMKTFFDPSRLDAVHPTLGVIDVVSRRGDPCQRAVDLLPTATGGLLYCNGFPDSAPDYPVGRLAFRQASFVATGVAAAMLLQQRRSGVGARAEISLQEAALSTTIQAANQNLWKWQHAICERAGMDGLRYPFLGKDGAVALVGGPNPTFETADSGWAIFGMTPFTDARWRSFANWLEELTGETSMQGDEWLDPMFRLQHRDEYHEAIRRLCRSLPKAQLAEEGQRRGLMVVPMNSVADVAGDEHLAARGVFGSVRVGDDALLAPALRSPFRSSAYEPPMLPPPQLGQHSVEALAEIGLPASTTDELRRVAGLVGPEPTLATASPERPDKRPRRRSRMAGVLPLAGYRVLDFTWQAAGPLVTEFLANLGADVIKVESLARIDTVREFHHPLERASIDTGAFFADCNTGKRSITLNLNHEEGVALALDLARTADVVTDNFTPGRMDRWGLGYESLRAVNPDIITASYPVMGCSGPKRAWRGIGNSVVAMCGLAWHTGRPGKPPAGLGTLHTDFTLAPIAAAQIIAALMHREETGIGQQLEIAQYEAALHLLDTLLFEYLANGTERPRDGNRSTEYAPHGVFRCAGQDRWVAICVTSTVEWQLLCTVMGRDDLARREDLQSLGGRLAAIDEIERAVESWTGERDAREVAAVLCAKGISASPLLHIGDLVESEPSLAGFFHEYEHPNGVTFLAQNQPFDWNGGRLPLRRAPLLGEHNEEIFKGELGIDEDRFVQLMVDEVIY